MNDFIVSTTNEEGLFGIFEDCEDTGYLYLSDHTGDGIIDHLHIYDHPEKLGVVEGDVEVVWTNSGTKCGVKVWGKFYGIFDLKSDQKIAHYIRSKDTPPITDKVLLDGF